ncbi:unnamed protein product [Tenebrio molitor]|nr:unnamed protein product [Tenebrio molitor]
MRGTKWPAYLIVTDRTYTLDKLEQIKFVLNTKVSWQRHINNKIFVQCHRCQRWGHATANCHAQAKCVKCAGDHLTRTASWEIKSPQSVSTATVITRQTT